MKKTFLLTGIVLTLASAALAGPPKKVATKTAKTPDKIACAVMGDHKVDVKKATADKMYADYKGKRYFFCCAGCPDAFKKDPTKFAKAPSIPTPKASKMAPKKA